jgi:hypothetical protein
MFRSLKAPTAGLLVFLSLTLTASAQIGGTGWTNKPLNFKVQSPTNAPQNQRYWFTNNIYHCLTYSNDGAFSVGNTTLPRTEQRYEPDYTNGEIQYQALLMAPSNENSYCVFQIHTGDAQSTQFGSTTFMAFWFTNNGGSVHDYSGTTLATNLANKWFQLNVDHSLVTQTIRVWINSNAVWTQQDNGAGDFYMKDGVYEQSHGPTLQMDTFLTNILFWGSSGTNPPAGPTGLAATPTNSQIRLVWNSSVAATNYNIRRSTTSGGPYTAISSTSSTNFTDGTVTAGPIYYYVVSAVDSFGESTNSSQASATLADPGYVLSASPVSQTVAAGNTTNYTINMTTDAHFSGSVVFGVSGLPAGAIASFNPSSLSQAGSTILTVQSATNTVTGTYPLNIEGTNGAFLITTNATLTVNGVLSLPGTLLWTAGSGAGTNWTTAFNWTNVSAGAYGPPGTSNDLVFNNTAAVAMSNTPDNFADVALVVASLAFSNTNSYHTTLIAPGQTLTLSGSKGLTVGTETDLGTNVTVNAAIAGAGATLAISNPAVNVLVRQWTSGSSGGIQRSTLDLSDLDTFLATVNSLEIGNFQSNNTARSAGTVYLARTNVLTLLAPGQNVTTNAGIDVADNPSANSSQFSYLYLGAQNTIYADGITVGGGRNIGWMGFNPNFPNSSLCIRGTNGANSRVTRWLVGDNSGASNTGSNSRGSNDFTAGTVDALINTMILGRGESPTMNTGNSTGYVACAAGKINVNNLMLGVQAPGSTGGGGGTPGTTNYVGQIDVDGTATLIVESNLVLTSQSGGAGGFVLQGILNINGGSVETTNIVHSGGAAGTSIINLSSGTLDLFPAWAAAPGQIASVSTLNIGANSATDPALLANAGNISVANPIVIAGNGTISGNASITEPGLTVNGAISPGTSGPGWMTNNGPVTFGAGGNYLVSVQDAAAGPAIGWSFLQVNAGASVQAISGNPFVVQPQNIGPVGNFSYNTNFDWTIAAANGGITNFDPLTVTADSSLFANDLGGGYFYVRTNGNLLVLSFTNNHPPAAGPVSVTRTASILTIPVSTLAAQWSDPDGDPVMLASVSTSSTAGTNNVSTDGTYIYYTNAYNIADTITYTVQDLRTNPPAVYRLGDTVQTGLGLIMILPARPLISSASLQNGNLVLSGTGGLSNGNYYVLSSTNLTLPMAQWTPVATDAFDSSGSFSITNTPAPGVPQSFYLLQMP